MAALIETAPWIVALERHRPLLFSVSGVLLALNYWMVVVRPRQCAPGEVCHIDSPFMRFNRRLYWISLALFALALVATYGSLLVLRWIS
jgi:hypothetical protein